MLTKWLLLLKCKLKRKKWLRISGVLCWNLRVDNFTNKCFTNAEVVFLEFTQVKSVCLLVCIYRQPNTNVRVFISELTSVFERKRCSLKKNIIVGDINISMLLSNGASKNWIFFWMNLVCNSKLQCLLTKVVDFRPSHYFRGG